MKNRIKSNEATIAVIISLVSLVISTIFSLLSYLQIERQNAQIEAQFRRQTSIDIAVNATVNDDAKVQFQDVPFDYAAGSFCFLVDIKVTNVGAQTVTIDTIELGPTTYSEASFYRYDTRFEDTMLAGNCLTNFNAEILESGHSVTFQIAQPMELNEQQIGILNNAFSDRNVSLQEMESVLRSHESCLFQYFTSFSVDVGIAGHSLIRHNEPISFKGCVKAGM